MKVQKSTKSELLELEKQVKMQLQTLASMEQPKSQRYPSFDSEEDDSDAETDLSQQPQSIADIWSAEKRRSWRYAIYFPGSASNMKEVVKYINASWPAVKESVFYGKTIICTASLAKSATSKWAAIRLDFTGGSQVPYRYVMKGFAEAHLPKWAKTTQPKGLYLFSSSSDFELGTILKQRWTAKEDFKINQKH